MLLGPRRYRAERLDEPDLDPSDLRRTLDDLRAVNRWLGGFRALRLHLDDLRRDSAVRILDVGTGDAAALRHLAGWAPPEWRFTGVDLRPEIARLARARHGGRRGIDVVAGDALRLPFADDAFDVAICTLTLHHLEATRAVAAVREMARVSRVRVVVNDLERCLPNYLGALLLAATAWRRSRLTRHDGPLSVRRSFTSAELLAIGRGADLSGVRVRRRWPFRLVLEGAPSEAAGPAERSSPFEAGAGPSPPPADRRGGRREP